MFARVFLFPFLLLPLGACATVTAVPKVEESEFAKLRNENNGIVLLYTSLNDSTPTQVSVTLARPDEQGRYVVWRQGVPIKFSRDASILPGQLKIPAGDYGIVELYAMDKRGGVYVNRQYQARDMKLQGILLEKVYERPLAKFKVEAGEVVDIGSLQVIEGPRQRTLFGTDGSFAIKVGKTPDPVLKNLAERNPQLASARVVRTMTAPSQNP